MYAYSNLLELKKIMALRQTISVSPSPNSWIGWKTLEAITFSNQMRSCSTAMGLGGRVWRCSEAVHSLVKTSPRHCVTPPASFNLFSAIRGGVGAASDGVFGLPRDPTIDFQTKARSSSSPAFPRRRVSFKRNYGLKIHQIHSEFSFCTTWYVSLISVIVSAMAHTE